MKKIEAKEQGFSLVELIVVATLIGLSSGIAIASLFTVWNNERLNSVSKISVAWLEDLRRKAIQQSTACRASWNVMEATLNGQCDNDTSTIMVLNLKAEIKTSEKLSVSLEPDSPTTWIFTPRGTSTTSGQANFSLRGDPQDQGRCLRLSAPLGLIRSARRTPTGECDFTTSF